MVCFSLAVVKARVSPDVVKEVVNSEKALEGLRRLISQQAGVEARIRDRTQSHRPDVKVICIVAGSLAVNLFPAGITVQSAYDSQATLQAVTEAVDTAARRMAVALATDRSVALLKSRYVVASDQTQANGARVLKLSL